MVTYEEIKAKNYSLSTGQYFEVKIEYVDISEAEFQKKLKGFENNLKGLFGESKELEKEIQTNLQQLKLSDDDSKTWSNKQLYLLPSRRR